MKKTISFILLLLSLATLTYAVRSPQEIINRLNENFSQIKDAQADITLDTGLQLLGCSGLHRQKGRAFFKAPDKIKVSLDRDAYFIKGNSIRKIDSEGNRFYVQLIHALDFSPGFHPGLIPHNFYLKITKETPEEIVMEGLPKPGVLKNVKKVFFYIDPQESLLHRLKMSFANPGLSGRAEIKYEKINNLWVPVATSGKSAVEINSDTLVSFNFILKGEKFKINTGLTDKLFDPGF